MKAVIICEASQTVTKALRAKGIEAYSCDILEEYGGHPEWHIQEDGLKIIKKGWDFIGLHCPCTYTALSGNRYYAKTTKREEGAQFTKLMWELAKVNSKRAYLEQPRTIIQDYIGRKNQVIQPWQFGHGEVKETWLWLNNLPNLTPTNIVSGREQRIWRMPPGQYRQRERSKTYQGIAEAIAQQWFNI